MRFAPPLFRSHPNFFIIFFTIGVVFHFGIGLSQVLAPERYDTPALELVRPIQLWGAAHLLCWALMAIGAYRWFHLYARLGLALGFFLCLTRGLLIELSGVAPGGGLFVWVPMAVQHFVQMAEPQTNPLTAKG